MRAYILDENKNPVLEPDMVKWGTHHTSVIDLLYEMNSRIFHMLDLPGDWWDARLQLQAATDSVVNPVLAIVSERVRDELCNL